MKNIKQRFSSCRPKEKQTLDSAAEREEQTKTESNGTAAETAAAATESRPSAKECCKMQKTARAMTNMEIDRMATHPRGRATWM
mmetsp:Transcript_4918/g.6018  ORF Transcript_4918/g.6018 Transcript_4918/m.6018 type:complete len:84 (-) Transcript_4918:48-299(-)